MERKNQRGQARGQQFDDAPPSDIEAERAVLAAVLLEPCRNSEVTAALDAANFTDRAHHTIYTAMLSLQQRGLPADATLVVGELRDRGQYNVDEGISTTTLVDLFKLFPLACHLPFYLERVVAVAQRRHALGQSV
jgi:replicative DNA helicase